MQTTDHVLDARMSAFARLAGVALIGVAIGSATSFAQTWLDGTWQALSNSASPWLAGAFLAGAMQFERVRAIFAGLGACVLEVAAYYVVTPLRGYAVSNAEIIFWGVCAVVGGPLFGCAAWAWRRASVQLQPVGAAFLPATFIAEAIGTYEIRLHYHGDAVLFVVVGLVILVAMIARLPQLRHRTVLVTTGLVIVGIGVYWLGLNAVAGVAFGA